MSRKLVAERTYALKQYENIKLHDEVVIPDGKEFDNDLVEQIRGLQFIQLELHFLNYIKTLEKIHQYSVEDAITLLEQSKNEILDNIKGD